MCTDNDWQRNLNLHDGVAVIDVTTRISLHGDFNKIKYGTQTRICCYLNSVLLMFSMSKKHICFLQIKSNPEGPIHKALRFILRWIVNISALYCDITFCLAININSLSRYILACCFWSPALRILCSQKLLISRGYQMVEMPSFQRTKHQTFLSAVTLTSVWWFCFL